MVLSSERHSVGQTHPCRLQRQAKSQPGSGRAISRTLLKAQARLSPSASLPRPAYQSRRAPQCWSVGKARWTPATAVVAAEQLRLSVPPTMMPYTSGAGSPLRRPSCRTNGRLLVIALVGSASSHGAVNGSTGEAPASKRVLRAAVGIDLGTTTSAVALAGPDGRPVVVEDEQGRAVIPSVVFVRQDGTVLVGDAAVAAAESDPANAFYGIKRLLGRSYREALEEVDELNARASAPPAAGLDPASRHAPALASSARGRLRSYSLAEGRRGEVEVVCPALDRNLTPEEISAHLLRHLLSRASSFLERQRRNPGQGQGGGAGVSVLDAVITVPAHFGPRQRRAVTEAAKAAGLQRITLLQEPIAAAMAYGFGSPQVPYDVLLVFDLGGGTLDLTIVEAFEGIMEVLSTSGDNYLGGDDFTAAVADWLSRQLPGEQLRTTDAEAATSTTSTTSPSVGSAPSLGTSVSHQAQLPLATSASPSASGSASSAASSAASPTSFATASAPHSLALLRAAEAAKLALSEAVAAARSEHGHGNNGSTTTTTSSSSSGSAGSSLGKLTVRVPLPVQGSEAGGPAGRSSGSYGASGLREVELTLETFEQLVRPLLRRIWWPLEEVAMSTRTQLGGRLPPGLDPRGSEGVSASGSGLESGSGRDRSGSGAGSSLSGSSDGSGSGSVWEVEGPGRREGAAAWEFSIFPPPEGSGAAAADTKYVAPPRRLSGVVLVGAATRLPVVRDYITEVTGLPVRPGVDPETAVALGAALHAGLMVGDVTQGIEMNDGGYVAGQHGRASGFQVAVGASSSSLDAAGADPAEPELVWEP